ncbi:MAG: outer membrane beta-barrel protein [Bacteroidota bacterium]
MMQSTYFPLQKHITLLFAILFLLLTTRQAMAQENSFGFKAGLNFSQFTKGELEAGEANSNVSGFHIGILMNTAFTDNFGLRSELLYAQRGNSYTYEGDSYFIFSPSDLRISTRGTRNVALTVSNKYIQLPIMGYAKFGRIEFMGGVYGSLRIGSLGDGTMTYQSDALGNEAREFILAYSYGRDEAGGFDDTVETVFINGNRVEIPSELGAYYEYANTPTQHLYKALDFGVVGGAAFYLGKALFIQVRAEYGLADVTNDDTDISIAQLSDNNNLLKRMDDDRNFTIHTAVGFRF